MPNIITRDMQGVDVSEYQGNAIDWSQVSVTKGFAIAKATQYRKDHAFDRNWEEIKNSGMIRAAYHFANPGDAHWETEADLFLKTVEAAGGFLPGDQAVLDLEQGMGDLSGYVLPWLERISSETGTIPWLYSRINFMQGHGLIINNALIDGLRPYPLWIASYDRDPDTGFRVSVHQYSEHGVVPGIAGAVDLNVALEDVMEMDKLTKALDDQWGLRDELLKNGMTKEAQVIFETVVAIKEATGLQ